MTKLSGDPARMLLSWYGKSRRSLPWRARPGEAPDPYRVWLSEIMLQQTTVVTVIPYFEEFVRRWPTLRALAAAELDEVLHAWQGLGYYARARNLHKCAKAVVRDHDGFFPGGEEELLKLPGVGPYTAAAIAAIAFNRRTAPVDGNILRVISRLMRLETPLPRLRTEVSKALEPLVPEERPGDFVQAMMDLGAVVCAPGQPDCRACPWNGTCAVRATGEADAFPRKPAKKKKPTRYGVVFWAQSADGRVLLRRRAEKGLLGGMMEMPSTDWRERAWGLKEALRQAPLTAQWRPLEGTIRHAFTHFHLKLTVVSGRSGGTPEAEGVWSPLDKLSDHALPTVMKKVVRHALKGVSVAEDGEQDVLG